MVFMRDQMENMKYDISELLFIQDHYLRSDNISIHSLVNEQP
jgi:hypothetical protein